MVGSYYNENELKEMFSNALEKQRFAKRYALDSFLSILFWKDYKSGHISPEIKQDIFRVLDTVKNCGSENSEYLQIDVDKAIIVANLIRNKIGLKQLKMINNIIQEVD